MQNYLSGLCESFAGWAQIIFWIGGPMIGAVTAFLAIKGWAESRKVRENELRWKQANLGRELIDEMYDDGAKAGNAMELLEYVDTGIAFPHWQYSPKDTKNFIIKKDFIKALSFTTNPEDEKIHFIRKCFEEFLFYCARFHHFLKNGLIQKQDVSFPFEYYAHILYDKTCGPVENSPSLLKNYFVEYAEQCKYKNSLQFLGEFDIRFISTKSEKDEH